LVKSESTQKLAQPVHVIQPDFPIGSVLDTLDTVYQYHPMAAITRQDPYKVLTACILSLRTKDETSIPASERMFVLAETPQDMVNVPIDALEKAIFPVGFYRNKARTILDISQDLLTRFNGQVPNTIDDLLTLKGVGRKTANLVMGLGHGLPAICVDIHVHRICNRFGYIVTDTPEQTEWLLRDHLPLTHWAVINKVLVLHGQACCRPVSPHCDCCPVADVCQKVNVKPRKKPG
jgi:endonuclease III